MPYAPLWSTLHVGDKPWLWEPWLCDALPHLQRSWLPRHEFESCKTTALGPHVGWARVPIMWSCPLNSPQQAATTVVGWSSGQKQRLREMAARSRSGWPTLTRSEITTAIVKGKGWPHVRLSHGARRPSALEAHYHRSHHPLASLWLYAVVTSLHHYRSPSRQRSGDRARARWRGKRAWSRRSERRCASCRRRRRKGERG
jgi:hypothetical protein